MMSLLETNTMYSNTLFKSLPWLLLFLAGTLVAADRDEAPLDEKAFRLETEEVLVTGQALEWREQEQAMQRDEKFRLADPEDLPQPRFEWFPAYTEDERDRYADGPRDRLEEKAGLKLFEGRF